MVFSFFQFCFALYYIYPFYLLFKLLDNLVHIFYGVYCQVYHYTIPGRCATINTAVQIRQFLYPLRRGKCLRFPLNNLNDMLQKQSPPRSYPNSSDNKIICPLIEIALAFIVKEKCLLKTAKAIRMEGMISAN